jgi:AraC-like DNA-binding protein
VLLARRDRGCHAPRVSALFQPFPMLGRRRAQAWRYQPQYRRPRHFHPEPELNFVLRGQARFAVGSQQLAAAPGTVLWLAAGMDHALLEASPDLELYVVGFQPELLDRFAAAHGRLDFALPPRTVDVEWLRRAADCCGALDAACAMAAEEQLLGLLRRLTAQAPRAGLARRADALLARTPALDRTALARALGSNQGDVSRAFRRELGVTLRELRQRRKLIEFVQRVDGGEQNLGRAAALAGFGSYSQCYRVFLDAMGARPRAFFSGAVRQELADRFEPLPPTGAPGPVHDHPGTSHSGT